MSERQFDIFDDSFRMAAEQFEPEFNEAAWQKMEAKLDGKERNRKPFYWFRWLSDGLMISLIIAMAFPILVKHESKKITLKQATEKTAGNKTVKEPVIARNTIEEKKTGTVQQAKLSIQGSKNDQPIGAKMNAGTAKNEHQNVRQSSLKSPDSDHSKTAFNRQTYSNQLPGDNYSDRNKKPGIIVTGSATSKSNNNQDILNSGYKSGEENDIISTHRYEEPGTFSTHANIEPLLTKTVSLNTDDYKATVKSKSVSSKSPAEISPSIIKTKDISFRGFYLHAAASPEYTIVKGNQWGPLTVAFGGGAGYSFGNRLSIQTGLFSTFKNYDAGPGDYKTKKGGYWDSVTLLHVDAKCNVLEIPVSVNYSLLNIRQHHLVASVGFASLIMRQENYNYDVMRSYGQPYYHEHSFSTNKFEPFASMMLAAGYMYSFSRKLSLVASPYLKIPLYGVGEGSVKITSAGMMIGLQYGILETGKHHK